MYSYEWMDGRMDTYNGDISILFMIQFLTGMDSPAVYDSTDCIRSWRRRTWHSLYPLVMTNIAMVFSWPIEIDDFTRYKPPYS